MERFEVRFHRPRQGSFDQAPAALRRRVFGVDYPQLRGKQSGNLFVTPHGWPVLDLMVRSHLFVGERLSKAARKRAKTNGIVVIRTVAHKLARTCYYMRRDGTHFDVQPAPPRRPLARICARHCQDRG